MDNRNIEIGKRIKQRRKELGMTQEELSKELGLNKWTIHRYETGKTAKIKLPVIQALAKQLRVNPEWLICCLKDNKQGVPRNAKLKRVWRAKIHKVSKGGDNH